VIALVLAFLVKNRRNETHLAFETGSVEVTRTRTSLTLLTVSRYSPVAHGNRRRGYLERGDRHSIAVNCYKVNVHFPFKYLLRWEGGESLIQLITEQILSVGNLSEEPITRVKS